MIPPMRSILTFLSISPRFLAFGQTFFITLSGGHIRATFGLGHGDFGMIYSVGTLSSAALLIWAGLQNQTANPPIPGDSMRCDQQGCVLITPDSNIALVWDKAALLEDYWRSDVILSAVPVRNRCSEPQVVIDRFDLWRDGAHALKFRG